MLMTCVNKSGDAVRLTDIKFDGVNNTLRMLVYLGVLWCEVLVILSYGQNLV